MPVSSSRPLSTQVLCRQAHNRRWESIERSRCGNAASARVLITQAGTLLSISMVTTQAATRTASHLQPCALLSISFGWRAGVQLSPDADSCPSWSEVFMACSTLEHLRVSKLSSHSHEKQYSDETAHDICPLDH